MVIPVPVDILAHVEDAALVRGLEAAHHIEQSRFARTGRSAKQHEGAGLDGEVDISHRVNQLRAEFVRSYYRLNG